MTVDPNPRRGLAVMGLILVAFGVLGVLRLNPFCLLEPDSPDYLFTSRAIVTLQGYTEIDHPGRPSHAFRPPGLPLLLAPLSAVLPGSVVAAKAFVLALTFPALLLVGVAARRLGGAVAGALAVLAVATGPYTLLHATEVASEMPYLTALLATWWLATDEREPSRGTRVAMGVLLSLLPLLRTVGWIWIAALAVQSVLSRSRRWGGPIAVALIVNAAWLLRNQRTGVVTYFSGMVYDFRELGAAGYLAKSLEAAAFYVRHGFDVLLPGVFKGPPLYERFLLEPALTLDGLWGAGYVVGVGVLALAAFGGIARWRAGGALVSLYAVGFVAVLLIYPPRHERLIWPLVPLVWIYAAAGAEVLRARLGRAGSLGRWAHAVVMTGVVLLAIWQGMATLACVWVNGRWLRDRAGFHERYVPPMYYADWGAAGRWLAANAPAGQTRRVLTRHSDLGFTSGLLQDSVRFEEISPLELHRRIATLRPRYLALPATRFGWLAPAHLLQGSPVYRFEPVYEAGDVLIVEVWPNREGTVRREPSNLAARIAACRAAVDRLPRRSDLRRRLGQLLHEAGKSNEAVAVLSALDSAAGFVSVGQVELDRDDPGAALDAFERARAASGAGALAATIARGAASARDALDARGLPVEQRVSRHLERCGSFIQTLSFGAAWRALERAEALAPGDLRAASARAALLERTGRYAEAEERYANLARRGVAGAVAAGEQLRRERALLDGAVRAPADVWLTLASQRAAQGLVGRALTLLEHGAVRHPGSAELRRRLGEIDAFYNGPSPPPSGSL